MSLERLSYCRICAAACGIVVTIDGDRVLRVRGDDEHPVSRGYICSKARGLPAWHHGPPRLDRPRLRGHETGWDEVLDDLARVVGDTTREHGPDAVALYLATGLAYDAAGQIAASTWLGSLGSRSFFTAATVDNAPVLVAAELVTGNPQLNPVWDPEGDGLLVLIGTNPVVSHGYGTTLPDPIRRLRNFRQRGGRVWVVDPRRTESAALADVHISIRPGSDVALLGAIAAAMLDAGIDNDEPCHSGDIDSLREALRPFDITRAAHAADVPVDVIERLVADVVQNRGKVAIFCGTGTTMARDGILVEWLRWVVLILSGSLDRPGGMRFNRGAINRLRSTRAQRQAVAGPSSRPELPRVAGQLPAVALADEIEAGHIRALLVTGGNPIAAIPEPDRLRSALRTLDALAVIDVVDNELSQIATHVLPATGQLERADLSLAEHVSVRSGVQWTDAVVSPVADRRPVWWMLGSLAQRLGGDFLRGVDLAAMTDEWFLRTVLTRGPLAADDVVAAGPRGIDVAVEHGWVRHTMLPSGHWQIAPPSMLARLAAHMEPVDELVLIPRREMAWSNSVRFAGTDAVPVAHVHPSTAAASGIQDGSLAVITSAHGSLTATIAHDTNVRPGVVSMTHGHSESQPGHLTSSSADVDPLTTMPLASGLAVSIVAQ